MRASILGLLYLLLCAIPSFGQSTTVSGTVTDLGGQAWNYGTYSFVFRPATSNPQGPYFWNGTPFSTNQTIQGNLSNAAAFSVSVPSNTSITPAGSTWTMQFCPAATAPCFLTNLTITGTTQNISGIQPPAVSVNLANPPAGASAYLDSEIVGAKPGSFYFNLNDGTQHFCTLLSFPACTWASQPNSANGLVQLINQNTSVNTVNAATTSAQGWPLFCTPCFSAGALNTVGKTFEFEFMGNGVWQANTGTSVSFSVTFGSIPGPNVPSGTVNPTGTTTIFNWAYHGYCVVATTGSSGSLVCNEAGFLTDANGLNYPLTALTFTVSAVNLTAAINMGGAVIFSTSSTSNSATTRFFILKQDN